MDSSLRRDAGNSRENWPRARLRCRMIDIVTRRRRRRSRPEEEDDVEEEEKTEVTAENKASLLRHAVSRRVVRSLGTTHFWVLASKFA